MWDYSETLKDHFFNPRNVGTLSDASGVGEVGSLACGDALRLFIRVNDAGRIEDARFQTFGCGSAIASASALTEMIKGKTVEEAARLTNADIAEFLGGMPAEKMHCSVMGREALEAAIANYRGEPPPEAEGDTVCKCFGVTREEIVRAIEDNDLSGVDDITNYTKAGGGCGGCHDDIAAIVREVHRRKAKAESEPEGPAEPAPLTNLQRMKRVEHAIDQEVRPALQRDGGDISVVDIDGPRVLVKLTGQCANCPGACSTLANFVQARLRDLVDPAITVEEA